MPTSITDLLTRLDKLVRDGGFEELETDSVEIKPVPAAGTEWKEIQKTANAFLNTRGGIILLGVKDEKGPPRRFTFAGYRPDAEPQLKELGKKFTTKDGTPLDVSDHVARIELHPFQGGSVAVVYVDELRADRKFVFFEGHAYRRLLTGDHRVSLAQIEEQEEFRQEAQAARELELVEDTTVEDLDLEALNQYIFHLNRSAQIETLKADTKSARTFLERKTFIRNEKFTILGMLTCGKNPGDHLGFRCHVHGYVDSPQVVAQDKQDFVGNIIPLMENCLAYVSRNIQVGVSGADGLRAQYPENVLRETVNNALAHRDYSTNKQGIITIKPNTHVRIQNPGAFRKRLLLETDELLPIRRIIPEAKPRNPKLADVLRVYRKWEGRGIGMSTLVNLCLQNQMDLPYYRLMHEEVALYLRAGTLVDDRMERLFSVYDRYIAEKLGGDKLTSGQQRVLAYLLKSEWANAQLNYTILLTPDNNHFHELSRLEGAGLISKHDSLSTPIYPVYVTNAVFRRNTVLEAAAKHFGADWSTLDQFARDVLFEVFCHTKYSSLRGASARQVAYLLWYASGQPEDIKQFDSHARNVRRVINRLLERKLIHAFGKPRRFAIPDL